MYAVAFYLGLTKSPAIVIGNFISQLTFKRLLHGEIVECPMYNHISSLDLVIVLFSDKLLFELKKEFLMNNELNRYYRKVRTPMSRRTVIERVRNK